jgi:hypothetical protein
MPDEHHPKPLSVNPCREVNLILLLGSYNDETFKLLKRLREFVLETFGGNEIYCIMLEGVDVYLSDRVQVLAEKWSEDKVTLFVFTEGMITDNVEEINLIDEAVKIVENFLRIKYQATFIRKVPIIEKLGMLANACRLIFVPRHRELTRGGELVELTYLSPYCGDRMYFLKKKKGIGLSAMVKEILDAFNVNLRTYNDEMELFDEVERIIRYRLLGS